MKNSAEREFRTRLEALVSKSAEIGELPRAQRRKARREVLPEYSFPVVYAINDTSISSLMKETTKIIFDNKTTHRPKVRAVVEVIKVALWM